MWQTNHKHEFQKHTKQRKKDIIISRVAREWRLLRKAVEVEDKETGMIIFLNCCVGKSERENEKKKVAAVVDAKVCFYC